MAPCSSLKSADFVSNVNGKYLACMSLDKQIQQAFRLKTVISTKKIIIIDENIFILFISQHVPTHWFYVLKKITDTRPFSIEWVISARNVNIEL